MAQTRKRCSNCREEYPATADYFYVRNPSGNHRVAGFQAYCIPCFKERNAENKLRRKLAQLDSLA